MSWREKLHYGHEVVGLVHDLLKVEPEWSIDEADGFVWWADVFAQTVWSDLGLVQNGGVIYRLHAETELVQGRDRRREIARLIQQEMDSCSFSACVYDQRSDSFKLHCSVYATRENAAWLQNLFGAAAALQVAEAKRIGYNVVTRCRAVPAVGGHPRSGLRSTPHPMLDRVYDYFKPSGSKPSRWIGSDEWEQVAWCMEREASKAEVDPQRGLVAQFPWEPDPTHHIHLTVSMEEPHPTLGNGLHFTLTVPLEMHPDAVAGLALELDELERISYKRCQMLGSWCQHDGKLSFRLFLPNIIYKPEQLTELVVSMSTRALWANEFFMEKYRAAHQPPVTTGPTAT